MKMVEDVNEDEDAPPEIKKAPKLLPPPDQRPYGFFEDGMPHPTPPPQTIVNIHPEDLPWELLREEYTPQAHAYFVKEVEQAFRNTTQPNARQFAAFWAVHPLVWSPGAGKTLSSPLPTDVRPMKGAAWFSSRDLATAYLHQIRLGWESWTHVLGFPQSNKNTTFGLSGPWSQSEIFRLTGSGSYFQDMYASKHVSIELEHLDQQAAEMRQFILRTRINQLEKELKDDKAASTSGYQKLLWDDMMDMVRFPHWWVDPSEVPVEYILAGAEPESQGPKFYGTPAPGSDKPEPWRPSVVVPWIEKRDKTKPSDMLIVPTPQPLAMFEHDGLACDFARALAFAVGHIQGRVPEPYEVPYTFNQIFVYGKIQVGNMWSGGSPTRFASWCKCHPSIFVAGATHGGVSVAVSEKGYAADNREVQLTPAETQKILRDFVTSTGDKVSLDHLDCPPTPNTAAVMETEDFPTELFTSTGE